MIKLLNYLRKYVYYSIIGNKRFILDEFKTHWARVEFPKIFSTIRLALSRFKTISEGAVDINNKIFNTKNEFKILLID